MFFSCATTLPILKKKMEYTLGLKEGRSLCWVTERPYQDLPRRSPYFFLHNSKCYFELKESFPDNYKLYMISTVLDSSLRDSSRSYEVTSYVLHIKEYYFRSMSFTQTSADYSMNIGNFDNISATIPDFHSRRTMRIIVIFEDFDESPVSLSLDRERDVQAESSLKRYINESDPIGCLENLSEDFAQLLEAGDSNPDVELKCGDSSVHSAHRNILSCRSKVFQRMLSTDMAEGRTGKIEIPDMETDHFRPFLRYLYTGKLPELTCDNAQVLYEAADKYAVEGLMRLCAKLLLENLTSDNACQVLILADARGDRWLKKGVIDYIIEQQIPLATDQWSPFLEDHPKLAAEVLNKAYRSHVRSHQLFEFLRDKGRLTIPENPPR